MLLNKLKNFHLILASQSPRRHLLMNEAGFLFDVVIPEGIEEKIPNHLSNHDIPVYLADLKASWFENKINDNDIVITADTIVLLNNEVIGKPENDKEAIIMLQKLNGKAHDVITGVCFLTNKRKKLFSSLSKVYFRNITQEEIEYYVKNYNPLDKAGAYGAQDWIGCIGIERIEGSYFNVMGLPIQQVYVELEKFIEK
jgi:septum formation protein